ncbi:MAG: hypothetical protein H0X64_02895 [Gemmatimonadaceae bacterium]|nr:hypothetical protein [Gemmatimonadaceae bacterium]
MSDRSHTPGHELADVEARLREMRRRKKVRWTMSQETAEMAIAALAMERDLAPARKPPAKSRRRRRRKKLL